MQAHPHSPFALAPIVVGLAVLGLTGCMPMQPRGADATADNAASASVPVPAPATAPAAATSNQRDNTAVAANTATTSAVAPTASAASATVPAATAPAAAAAAQPKSAAPTSTGSTNSGTAIGSTTNASSAGGNTRPRVPATGSTAATPRASASTTVATPAAAPASAAPARPAAPPALDLAALEQRLRDTRAIGVFTKLSIKNQVDDLLNRFRALYKGEAKTPLPTLRQQYEMLFMKVLTVVQDGDPPLATAIASSREAIWGVLSDPRKFAQI